eukprot:3926262-Heterocapsa_arctica.AAC.1
MWDLRSSRIVEWVLFLVRERRVWMVHVGPPCTTFSIARKPALRSKERPLGFTPLEEKTIEGNVLLYRCLLILLAVWLEGFGPGSFEHPDSAFSWSLPVVGNLFSKRGCGIIRLAMCAFGAPYRKNTKFGL